jgi:hypothetical protein
MVESEDSQVAGGAEGGRGGLAQRQGIACLGPVHIKSIGPVESANVPIKARGGELGSLKRLTSNAERCVCRLNPKGWPCLATPLR